MDKLFGSKIGLMLKEIEDKENKFTDREIDHFLIGIAWIQGTLNDYKRRIKNENKKSTKHSKREKNQESIHPEQ